MNKLLIATWNVNSVRTRLSQITNWINNVNPDVLCLQETKVIDDSFPLTPFEELGYKVTKYGQKSYNGVAIISKLKIENVNKGFTQDSEEKKILVGCKDNTCIRIDKIQIEGKDVVKSEDFVRGYKALIDSERKFSSN